MDADPSGVLTIAITGLLVILGAGVVAWVVSLRLEDASIADICWGPGFVVLAWLYCWRGEASPRAMIMSVLISLWGLRLAFHIRRRHASRGTEDARYTAMRVAHGDAFWWRSLLIVFWLQGVLLWVVAMPVLAVVVAGEPRAITVADVAGVLLFFAGFATESVADRQLAAFKAQPDYRHRILDTGLWRYSRHPNYFGDALLWWGLYVVACAVNGGWLTMVGPLLMTFLLRHVSGVTLTERSMTARPGYAAYVARTSPFLPWPPREGG